MSNSNIAFLVNSCDDYSDVLPLFLHSLNHYVNCRVKVYINTESINSVSSVFPKLDIRFLNNRENHWGKRLKLCLDLIDEEYIINVFDDYLLESEFSITSINCHITLLENLENLAVIYLNSASTKYHKCSEFGKYRILKNRCEYKVNSVPGIWNKNILKILTHDYDTPWSWEVFGTYRTFDNRYHFISINSLKKNEFNYDYNKGGAIYRGKWVKEVVLNANKKYNLNIDFKKRGFSSNLEFEKRSLLWKYKFLKKGYQTNGLNFLWFLYFYCLNKFKLL